MKVIVNQEDNILKTKESSLTRTERKKIETRKRIIETTVNLIHTKGYDGATMERIAEEVDIAKKTLYNYYPEKEAIISDYIKMTFQSKDKGRTLDISKLKDTRERMTYVIGSLMDGVRRQKVIFEKYLVYIMKQVINLSPSDDNDSGIGKLLSDVVKRGIEDGEIRNDLSEGMIEDYFVFIFIEVAKQFYLNPEGFDQDEVINKSVDIFLNGMKPLGK